MAIARLRWILLALAVSPAIALAQAGETPLAVNPDALARGDYEFRGYVTVEDAFDLFGVYRQGIGQDLDFGLRVGYTDAGGGGLHVGGDLRFGLPWGRGSELRYALAFGLQYSFTDFGDRLSIPFGVSLGADVGTVERPVMIFGLPYLAVDRVDPDNRAAQTDLEFGVEGGAEISLSRPLSFSAVLTIASNDDDHIELALGLIYRR